MKKILRKYVIISLSLYFLTLTIKAFQIQGNLTDFLYASFIMYLLLNILKPLLNIVFFPINLLTLNLSAWLINIGIFYIWSLLVPHVKIGTWNFQGLTLGSLQISAFRLDYFFTYFALAILFRLFINFFHWLFDYL